MGGPKCQYREHRLKFRALAGQSVRVFNTRLLHNGALAPNIFTLNSTARARAPVGSVLTRRPPPTSAAQRSIINSEPKNLPNSERAPSSAPFVVCTTWASSSGARKPLTALARDGNRYTLPPLAPASFPSKMGAGAPGVVAGRPARLRGANEGFRRGVSGRRANAALISSSLALCERA